jgi:hypothetical protein
MELYDDMKVILAETVSKARYLSANQTSSLMPLYHQSIYGFVERISICLLQVHTRLAHIFRPVRRRCLVIDRVAAVPELRVAGVAVRVALGQPLRALPRLKTWLAVHDIDLLERERLGLVQEEVDHEAGGQVGAAEDEAEAVADAVGGVGG